jgi:hypothetical protein
MLTNGPLPPHTMHPPVSIALLAVVVKTSVFFCKFARMNVLTIRVQPQRWLRGELVPRPGATHRGLQPAPKYARARGGSHYFPQSHKAVAVTYQKQVNEMT